MMATIQDSTDDATMSDATAQPDDAAAAPKKVSAKRKPRKVKTPARVNEEEPAEGQEGEQPSTKAKKPRKPRQKAAAKPRAKKATPEGDAEVEAQDETNADEEEPESDPELHEIDPEALSMYTITKQKRYGKTSEREKKMAEIDWEEVKRKRRAEAEGFSVGQAQTNAQQKEHDANASTEDGEGATTTNKQDTTTRAVEGGLGFRVVNGEIVEDEETLQIDRRAQAQAEIAMQAPVEEEDELTRFHNRATYMNDRKRDEKDRVPMWKSKSDPWSEDETDRFYDALKNWGTDFMIISQLFPPKTRSQIKKKFNREERLDPERVNAALLGKDPVRAMDLNAYALAANLDVAAFNKFDSLEHAQSLISESMKDKEEAMRIAVKEAEETERQRAVHEAGKKKGREGAEERRKLAQAKKAMRSKGMVWGTGTFGGFGGGADEEGGGE
jgi:transcription factor TFIIIB component B''